MLNKERHKVDKKDTSVEGEKQKNTQGGMEGYSFWRQKRKKKKKKGTGYKKGNKYKRDRNPTVTFRMIARWSRK